MGKAVHLPFFPIQPLKPSSAPSSIVKEFALKTIPSVSKPEVKQFLESMFGLQIAKVRTLNMKGKTKSQGARLVAMPDYKKVYVTLKEPLPLNHTLNYFDFADEEPSFNKQSMSSDCKEKEVNLVA